MAGSLILLMSGHPIMRPSAIMIGASSGIGLALCRHLAARDYRIGIAARRKSLLDEAAASIPQVCCVSALDLSQPDEALQYFKPCWWRSPRLISFIFVRARVILIQI